MADTRERRVRVLEMEGGGEGAFPRLVLREERGVVEIVAGNVILLSTAALETERAFGRLVAEAEASLGRAATRVLVGGLGFGATVRGVLDVVPASTEVVVAEKFEAVVKIVRGELSGIAGAVLSDARVRLLVGDVYDALTAEAPDAVLLDVDNGPEWATLRENARLYTTAGLARAFAALAPGGLFAVWSGYPVDEFLQRLRAARFAPRLVPLLERGRVRARAYVGIKMV